AEERPPMTPVATGGRRGTGPAAGRTRALSLAMVTLLAGCATTGKPPAELAEARSAQSELTQGPASTLAPEAYREAQEAMAAAESAQRGMAPPSTVRDLAYVARRKAERAEVLAEAAQRSQTHAETEVQREAQLVDEQLRLKQELEAARQRPGTS